MKNKLNVKRSSCTNAIYAEFGRFPLIIKQKKVQVLKYWQQLRSLPHEHVLKQSYNCLKELKELGKCNWRTYVHAITIQTGFEGAWEAQILDKKHLV